MNILLATSEVVPFAKTGGLADVCGALPLALKELGHEVAVIAPAYRATNYCGRPVDKTAIDFIVPIGGKTVTGHILKSSLPGEEVPVYLIQQDLYYDREGLYGNEAGDHYDNCERFVFLCRAIMEAIRLLDLKVDVLHANDWQTALATAYLKTEYAHSPDYENIASLLTIHNMAFQGVFWHWDMLLTGLDWKYFNWKQMEFHDQLNLLKTGVVFADSLNTVSPQYAQEIQTPDFGYGLEGVLSHRASSLSGIVNGVDYRIWNPATDDALTTNYDETNWREGKAANKSSLQRELGLATDSTVPLIGMVSRLTEQKGFDLALSVMQRWLEQRDVQWVVLGTGDSRFHDELQYLAGQYPQKLAIYLGFDDALAHRIQGAADMFLMPSRFEPCGLTQLYALKYGAVPVVRSTGGLVDTICDANDESIASQTATGFHFPDAGAESLEHTLDRACRVFWDNADGWEEIVVAGMRQDWSWTRSAKQYVNLYEETISRKRS